MTLFWCRLRSRRFPRRSGIKDFYTTPVGFVDSLLAGRRLLQPIGPGGAEDVVVFERGHRGLERRSVVTRARFVRLYGRYAYR